MRVVRALGPDEIRFGGETVHVRCQGLLGANAQAYHAWMIAAVRVQPIESRRMPMANLVVDLRGWTWDTWLERSDEAGVRWAAQRVAATLGMEVARPREGAEDWDEWTMGPR